MTNGVNIFLAVCVFVCLHVCCLRPLDVNVYMKESVKTSIFGYLVHGICILSFYCVCQQF
jgi:hypothetical protein